MSSYGEKRDRDDKRTAGDIKAIQDGIQSSRSFRRSGPVNKKKNAMVCVSFLIFLIVAVVVVIIVAS